MDLNLFIGIAAGILVIIGLLFLSMIHLFMIPKDVMDRDTKPRPPRDVKPPEDQPSPTAQPQPPAEDESGKP